MGEIPGYPGLVPFRKGGDPRQRPGSPAFSRRILAHLNVLADCDEKGQAVVDLPALRRIAKDRKADHARAVAADILSYVRTEGWDKISRQPKMLSTLSWLFDRQLGRPLASISVEHTVKRSATEVLRDMARALPTVLMAHPELLVEAVRQKPELADMLRKVIETAPVETVAKAIEGPAGSGTWDENELVVRSLK